MRGKVFSQHRKYNSNRITPAYAGKSAVVELLLITRQDHPRLCGESHFRKIFFRPFRDHPRLCGEKKLDREEAKDLGGITPAYAGKRTNQYEPVDYSQDHPRLCGEKSPSRCRFLPCHVDHPRLCGEKMI